MWNPAHSRLTSDNGQPRQRSRSEAAALAQHEATIERGLRTFYDVGMALLAIRDSRLYRLTHGTFEAYCRERWGISRAYAYDQIRAAEVMRVVSGVADTEILSEKQVKPLRTLEPDQQRTAWAEAVATAPDGKVTGKHVAAVVKRLYPKDTPQPVEGTDRAELVRAKGDEDATEDQGGGGSRAIVPLTGEARRALLPYIGAG